MAITEPYELDGVTIGSTEVSIVSGNTALPTITEDGVYQLWIDPVAAGLVNGDSFEVRIYEKVEATGGTKRTCIRSTISNIQSELLVFPTLVLMHGWDMTIKKISGTDRAFDASIRAVTGSTITELYELDGVDVTTELSIVSGTTSLQTVTTPGFYQLWVDPTDMAADERYTIRIYEKVEATDGTKRVVYRAVLDSTQNQNFFSPVLLLKNGWDMTIARNQGAGSANFDASIRKIG